MREQRKHLRGVVTSDKMDKTAVVAVTASRRHPIYGKIMHLTKKYKVHDENNECREGDFVEIIESRPISRHKRFALVSILERAR
ncbi:MAG: 30S ribosomal protein S17 [Anaerolineales bacterium]|nr:30S ribosomal protein S17 [Anaerolineales bacterium]MCB9431435.1 30S ribosomal protein S17 [Ardenticatenaceae bacterium]